MKESSLTHIAIKILGIWFILQAFLLTISSIPGYLYTYENSSADLAIHLINGIPAILYFPTGLFLIKKPSSIITLFSIELPETSQVSNPQNLFPLAIFSVGLFIFADHFPRLVNEIILIFYPITYHHFLYDFMFERGPISIHLFSCLLGIVLIRYSRKQVNGNETPTKA